MFDQTVPPMTYAFVAFSGLTLVYVTFSEDINQLPEVVGKKMEEASTYGADVFARASTRLSEAYKKTTESINQTVAPITGAPAPVPAPVPTSAPATTREPAKNIGGKKKGSKRNKKEKKNKTMKK
jgi:hypothetical protein